MEDMSAPAAAPGLRLPVGLRRVTADDREFLVGVYASTRADELAPIPWNEAQKDTFVRAQFDAQQRAYEARYPAADYYVILFDGQPAGRMWIGRDAEQIRLLDIALLPEFRNRGIGTALLRDLAAEAAREGKWLRHMVFKLNTAGVRFYERLGFTQIEDVGAYVHMEYRRPEPPARATTAPDD